MFSVSSATTHGFSEMYNYRSDVKPNLRFVVLGVVRIPILPGVAGRIARLLRLLRLVDGQVHSSPPFLVLVGGGARHSRRNKPGATAVVKYQ